MHAVVLHHELLEALNDLDACIVEEGAFPCFNVARGADFDAACRRVKAAIAAARQSRGAAPAVPVATAAE